MTETTDSGAPNRRTALKAAGATLGIAAFAKAVTPIVQWAESGASVDEFLQKHYRELTPEELQIVLRRIEQETLEEYGAEVTVTDVPALPNTSSGTPSICPSASAAGHAPRLAMKRTTTIVRATTRTSECSKWTRAAWIWARGRSITTTRCLSRTSSTCRSSASNVTTLRVSPFARSRLLGKSPTAS